MNIYVGNLSGETTEDSLSQAFAAFGRVQSVRIVRDGTTGESKGFGFVAMPIEDEGETAISEMNGKDLDGQAIKVEKGRAKTNVVRGRGGQRGLRGGRGGAGRRDSRGGGGRGGGSRADSRGRGGRGRRRY